MAVLLFLHIVSLTESLGVAYHFDVNDCYTVEFYMKVGFFVSKF